MNKEKGLEIMLQQKTPLRQRTPLKAKTKLVAKTRLTAKVPIRRKKTTKLKYKPRKHEPYQSIFTDDMNKCYITKVTKDSGAIIDPHHIFGGPDKAFSEKYHFMLPLRRDWHETASYSIHSDRKLAEKYMLLCQEYWIEVLHKKKEEWCRECRMWYEKKSA